MYVYTYTYMYVYMLRTLHNSSLMSVDNQTAMFIMYDYSV